MKIIIISTSDIKGGASKPAYNLHRGLIDLGIESRMMVQKKFSDDLAVLGPETKWKKFLNQLAGPAIEDAARFLLFKKEDPFKSPAVISSVDFGRLREINPDIVNVHWFNRGYMKPEDFKKINCPIVWTFHDMWPFCGAEHYVAEGDIRYREGYNRGNRPKNQTGLDVDKWVWRRKEKVLKNLKNLTMVAPSRWLTKCAQESYLFSAKGGSAYGRKNYPICTIPYGVNTKIFKPLDKNIARNILNLPLDKKIILFGAMNGLDNPRKGFSYLKSAIDCLCSRNSPSPLQGVCNQTGRSEAKTSVDECDPESIQLCPGTGWGGVCLAIFGASKPKEKIGLNCPIYYLGKFNDDIALSIVYSAADVLVAPSIQDNLPNTVLESLACGTPVVAFNIGGLPDLIEHQKSGYLARPFEVEDLASGIKWVLDLDYENYQNLCSRAREKCEQEFTIEIQAKKYLELYKKIITLSKFR
ncbi:MAG: glycosyltransferase [Patescibacteria group bacterium]